MEYSQRVWSTLQAADLTGDSSPSLVIPPCAVQIAHGFTTMEWPNFQYPSSVPRRLYRPLGRLSSPMALLQALLQGHNDKT